MTTDDPRHPCPYCGTMLDEDDCVESDIPAVNGPTLHSASKCREYVYAALQSYKREFAQADKAADARWCAALELADWDGGVFHYEGRIYPWPTGFVPDCPATWESKTGPLEAAIAQARAEVERLTRENARIEAESRSDKALINRITRICDECPEESACEACEGSGVVPIDERAWTFGAAEKDRADKAEAERDAAQRENARLVAALSEAVAWLGAAKRSGTFDPKTYADIDRAFWAARNALSSCSPAPAADAMALVLHVAPNDDAELTCLLCGCATNAPPELCTNFLTPDGSSTAGLHRRCYERAMVPRRGLAAPAPEPEETP